MQNLIGIRHSIYNMKTYALTAKFYIIFSLLASFPSFWLSSKINTYLSGLPETSLLHYLSLWGFIEAPTTIVIILFIFWILNNCLWRWLPVRKLFGIPNIDGRYEGEIVGSFTETKEQNGTYKTAIEIKQTLTKVIVCLYTERSCSYSLTANLCRNNNGNYELVYIYQNKTSAIRTDSDMRDHNGTAILGILDDGYTLDGNYFNNPRERGRYGKIKVTKVNSKIKGKF